MSTEFNTAEELPVELPEERGENWRQEMQSRLQQYRERRGRGELERAEPPAPSRVIPFRRAHPSRTMEWAIPDPAGQPECIPPGLSQAAPAAPAPKTVPVPPSQEEIAAPPIVRTGSPEPRQAVAAPAARPKPAEPASPAADPSAPAAPQIRRRPSPAPAEAEVAEPVIRPRERRVSSAPPMAHSAQHRVRIELNSRPVEPEEELHLNLPQPAAPRSLRFSALVTDTFYVLAGSALFATAALARLGLPQQMPDFPTIKRLTPVFVGVPGLLFAVYVLLSYTLSDGTPGMKQAGLEVRDFDGKRAGRKALRRRGWAMVLSLAACGIGLLWANCDSDTLTLHDHISSTYLTVRRRARPPQPRNAAAARKPAPGKTPRKPGQA